MSEIEIVDVELEDLAQDPRGKRYTPEQKEAAFQLFVSSGTQIQAVAETMGIDRGTGSRWAKEGEWYQRYTMAEAVMDPSEERKVAKTILEMKGPSAAATIVGIMEGRILDERERSTKVRLDAAKTLLNRIGFPEMKITEYVERVSNIDDDEVKKLTEKPISEMTSDEKLRYQRLMTERRG